MTLPIPKRLATSCAKTPERSTWLARLPQTIRDLQRRWSVSVGEPFNGDEVSCAWVAPAVRQDGTAAVLKLGMPHMEGRDEIEGLRFWDGDPTVRLLESDTDQNAMLLERCQPGTTLRTLPEPEQDLIIARLLKRLWRSPAGPHPFRPLSALITYWSDETRQESNRWPDQGLVRLGLEIFRQLSSNSPCEMLLATDLHAGNVLRAERQEWLVIDPKPFLGDPAYDATQHLLNCVPRLLADPDGTIRRFADLLGVDHQRVRLWMFARAAAAPRDNWDDDDHLALARALAP